jgi:hypothetical protein
MRSKAFASRVLPFGADLRRSRVSKCVLLGRWSTLFFISGTRFAYIETKGGSVSPQTSPPFGWRPLFSREQTMIVTILVILLILFLLGGGYGFRSGNNALAGGGGLLGLILLILIILLLLGHVSF